MSDRSLKATAAGIQIAKNALTTKMLTQERLANDLNVTRSTISNFFNDKVVDRQIFVRICKELELNWQEISGQLPYPSGGGGEGIEIKALVKLAREACAEDIWKRCGTMRVLDMEQPIALSDIYTDVNILEKLTRNQRGELDELMAKCEVEEFYRWGLGEIQQKRVEGIKAVKNHSKLMILGKPGAGKTTFLKFLAMSCIDGKAFADLVPIFVTLKDFADREHRPSLLQFLMGEFSQWQVEIEPIFKSGKALVLLDGLDEVRAEYDDRVLREIREFERNYSQSQIVVTCRIAAKQYIFEQFTEVEVADFDKQQIATFAGNWFRKKEINAEDFLEELKKYRGVQELATSPLLLTLLCLAFEESGSFPVNRAELYKEGLDALLRKWDSKRGIRRDSVYKDLSVQKKEDMLSQIALTTFEKGDYFVKQRQLEDYIGDYIRNTANAKTNDEELHLDSEAVLKSIEAQHGLFVERARGIYSFSHLTFHEYFAARQIVVSTSPSKLEAALQNLVTHITDKRWREVILLSVGMAREADDLLLLMKRKIDGLLANDEKLQSFLAWADEKSRSVNVSYKLVVVRAYYFALALNHKLNLELVIQIARNGSIDLSFDLAFALASTRKLDRSFGLSLKHSLDYFLNLSLNRNHILDFSNNFSIIDSRSLDRVGNLALDLVLEFSLELALKFSTVGAINLSCSIAKEVGNETMRKSLQSLRDMIVNPIEHCEVFDEFSTFKFQEWNSEFRQILIEYRNIGYDWQFTDEQKSKLQTYYSSNIFLVECLNSDCYVSRETRQEIEDSLLLPSKR